MTKKYEEMITDLKEIVRKIEDNETNLEEMIVLYEQGTNLVHQCEEKLAEVEVKITELGRES